MEGRVISAFSYRLLERRRVRERRREGGKRERERERESESRLIKMATGRTEEVEGRMRDGWLTQSWVDVWRGLGCPSIERAFSLTRLDLIDNRTESFPGANRHITLVCKHVAELPSAKGLFNIHEGAFKDVRQLFPPSTATTAARLPTSFTTNTHFTLNSLTQQTLDTLVLPDKPVAWRKAVTLFLISPGTF